MNADPRETIQNQDGPATKHSQHSSLCQLPPLVLWGFQPLYWVGQYCSSSHHGGHTMECRNWVPLLWWLIHVDTQCDGRGLKMLNSQHVPLPFHFHSHQVMRKNIRLVNSRNLTGQDHNRILSQIGLPSSNQTWQWKLSDLYRWFSYLNDHLKVISIAMFDYLWAFLIW